MCTLIVFVCLLVPCVCLPIDDNYMTSATNRIKWKFPHPEEETINFGLFARIFRKKIYEPINMVRFPDFLVWWHWFTGYWCVKTEWTRKLESPWFIHFLEPTCVASGALKSESLSASLDRLAVSSVHQSAPTLTHINPIISRIIIIIIITSHASCPLHGRVC